MPVRDACAKINLYLRVDERLPSGYHRIRSVMLPLPELRDRVSVDQAPPGTLTMRCSDPELPTDDGNLCVRAARAFAKSADQDPAWSLHLDKRIPVAAGLGGGSSDAAALLKLLNDSREEPLPESELHALAAALGADVPFFLDPAPRLVTGVGEKLEAMTVNAAFGLVLVNPGFPIPARWAYRHWQDAERPVAPDAERLVRALAEERAGELPAALHNDLEFCAFRKFPILEMLRDAMLEVGFPGVHLSGSGPTLFGVCESGRAESLRQAMGAVGGLKLWTFATEVGTPARLGPSPSEDVKTGS